MVLQTDVPKARVGLVGNVKLCALTHQAGGWARSTRRGSSG